jgi:hypothetical protein
MSISPSATMTRAIVTTAPTKASGTTRDLLESASPMMKSQLPSVIRAARSRGTSLAGTRRSYTSNASPSSSASPSASPLTRLSLIRMARRRRRRMMRETSREHKVSKTLETSSMTSSVAIVASRPSTRRSLLYARSCLSSQPYKGL